MKAYPEKVNQLSQHRPHRRPGVQMWLILAVLLAFSCLLSTAVAVAQDEPTPTDTPAPPPTDTPIPPTDTPTPPPTDTPVPPPTDTPTSLPTDTPAPAPTDTPTPTDTPPPTDTPTDTPTPTETPTETIAPTETITPTVTTTPTETATPSLNPTLTTNKAIYIPGEVITISGAGFAPDTTYEVPVIRPDGGTTQGDGSGNPGWDTVTTDAAGAFSYTYKLDSLLGNFNVQVYTYPWAGQGSGQAPLASTTLSNVERAALIVRLMAGLTPAQQHEVITRNGGLTTSSVPALSMYFVDVPYTDLANAIQRFRSDSQVASVESDKVREAGTAPSDPSYPDQWALPKIGWDSVFGSVTPTGSSVVAILDTGIEASHPDLSGLVLPGYSVFEGGNALTDPNGHGTHMAGIVAARTDNGTGIAGVAYAGVSLLPVQVLGADGLGQDSDIISGLVWATDAGADVILMAFSNPGYSPALQAAIDYAWDHDVILVAATGNDNSSSVTYPAGDRAVMGISSTDQNDALAPGSNYGPAVFLAAPGVDVPATNVGGGVTSVTGTSSAAAQVAGAAALLRAVDPGLSNGVIVGRLARTADPAGTQEQTGNGRLNLARALSDTGLEAVKPAGAAPNGNGGPLVGPYVAADNTGTLTISDPTVTEGDSGTTNMIFTITYTRTAAGLARVSYATANGTTNPATGGAACNAGVDYISKSGTISYPNPTTGVQTFTIQICGDLAGELNETLFVNLSNANDVNLVKNKGVGTIIDNDGGGTIVISKVAVGGNGAFNYTGSGTGVSATFGITTSSGTGSQTFSNITPGTKTITETVPSGWDLTGLTCNDPSGGTSTGGATATIGLAAGETVTCTFTNTLQTGSVILNKVAVGGNDTFSYSGAGTGISTNFSITTSGGSGSQTFSNITPGTKTITESAPSGWALTGLTCNDSDGGTTVSGQTANIDLDANQTVTCTFTNTKQGHIIVDKVTDPSSDPTSFAFSLTDGPSALNQNFNLTDASTPYDSGAIKPGSGYNAAETVPVGWTLTSATCNDGSPVNNINLSPGETVTCTFTNTLQQGMLTVNKVVVPGTDSGLFNLQIDGSTAGTGANVGDGGATGPVPVSPGSHTVSETAGTNTDLADYVTSIGGDCAPDGAITLTAGDNKVCTITNTKRGHIVVNKQTIGGNGSFAFSASYDGDGFTLSDGDSNDSGPLASGPYSVSETVPAGWDLTSATCNDDDGSDPANIVLDPGEEVTCTFTNMKRGSITIVKEATPEDAQDFTFTTDIPGSPSVTLDDDADNTLSNTVVIDVAPGTYNISEGAVTGWDLTSATCSDGSPVSAIAVAPGEEVTCTFTNVKRGQIIIKKETNPDGDTTDFTFSTSYDADGFILSDGESNTSEPLVPGTYSISETAATGWKLVSVICNSSNGGTEAFNNISLQPGETVTCTFTNRKQVSLTVIKDATPADGTNFSFLTTIPLHSIFFLDDAAVDDNDGITDTFSLFVDPGNYTIVESAKDGWNLTGINCVTSDPNTGLTTVNNVAFLITSVGETVTCTFTNVKRGTITVVKDAVEETGTDFTINLGGDTTATATLDDPNPDDNDGIDSDFTFSLPPGDYTLSEVIPPAWNLNSIVCTTDDDEDVTVTTNLAEIALDAGENVTCTFTNELKKATITIIKDANPADGTNFSFLTTIPAHNLFFLDDAAVDDNDAITDTATFVVFPGNYTILESIPGGWNLTSLVCVTSDPATGITIVNNVAFFVAGGNETITCTFTNTKRASITIVKDATPEDETDFSFTGELGNFSLDDDGGSDNTLLNQKTVSVTPGTYSVSEAAAAGWTLTGLSCNDSNSTGSVQTAIASISVQAGENVTCTFTNALKLGNITIIKDAVPDDGQDFEFVGSDPIGVFSLDDDATGTLPNQQTFVAQPGSYSVQESTVSGWDLSDLTCQTDDPNDTTNVDLNSSVVTIDLDDGENITCTFTNVKRGKITVVKDATPADGTDFTISVGGDGAGNIVLDDIEPQDGDIADTDETISFVPGDYTLTELDTPGWNLASLVCSTDDPDNDVVVTPNLATIPLEAGENVTCTFTNVRESGSITIIKDAIPDDAQDFSFSAGDPIGSFSLDDDADGTLLNQQTFTVVPGSYSFQEDSVPGWDLTAIDCQTDDLNDTTSADLSSSLLTVDLDDGENITCTFTNVKRGKITVVKDADPADGTNFTISVGGDGAGNIVLDDAVPDDGDANQSSESVLFAPGSYTLTELVPAGWNLASLSCETTDTGEPVTVTPNLATIHLDTGEEVTCTFINKKRGQIIVDKVTVPGGQTQVFTFTTTGAGYAGFSLTDTAAPNDQELVPGTYSVSETVPTGWDLTSAACDGGNSPAAISLQAAQTVTCVFTNTQRGSITIIKDAVPDDNQIFDFGGDLGNFSLVDNGLVPNFTTFSNLAPGPYSVSETMPVGWDLTGLNCNDSNGSTNLNTATATINLDPGETVTCTFINDPLPDISVTKTASPSLVSEPGGSITFSVTVNNTSVEILTLTSLVDDVYGNLDGQGTCVVPQTIGGGDNYACSFTGLASGDAGDVLTDTVTATVKDDENNEATDTDDATVTITDATPTITVVKTASPTSVAEPGGNVTFSVTVSNTSVETLTLTSLTDDVYGNLDGQGTCALTQTIGIGDSFACSFTGSVSGDAGDVLTDTVTATAKDNEGNEATDKDDATVEITNVNPIVSLTKSASPLSRPEPGGVFTFTLTFTNTSVEVVEVVTLTDTQSSGTDFSDCETLVGDTLALGTSTSCVYTLTHTNTGSYPNTASVTVKDDENNEASDTDTETVSVTNINPTVSLTKSASPLSRPEPGGVFTFTLIFTNTSVEAVTITQLTDTNTLSQGCLDLLGDTLNPGQVVSCQYTTAHTNAGVYTNTASVTVKDDENNEASDDAAATVSVTNVNPTVSLDKAANPLERLIPGGVFTFTLTISNTSVEPVTITQLTDTNALSQNCLDLVGDTLTPGQVVTCQYTVTRTGAGVYTITAQVTVKDDEGNSASAGDSVSVFVSNPAIAIDKNGPVFADGGKAITYTYTVTNASNLPLSNVSVSDDKCGSASYVSGDTNSNNVLDLSEVWNFKCTYTPSFNTIWPNNVLKNIATAKGQYQGQQVSAKDDYKLYPFYLRKRVFLYWDSPVNTLPYPEPDGTAFTIHLYKGLTLLDTFTISQSSPKRIWLSEGSYNFYEDVPVGYEAGHNPISFTTNQGYPDWTIPNIITFDLAVKKSGPTYAFKGNTITYYYTVTNAGPASVVPTITDNKCKPITFLSGDTDHNGVIDVGEIWTYKCNYKVTQKPDTTIKNIVTVDDAFIPVPGWYLGGDRNPSDNMATWEVKVWWYACTPDYWKQNTAKWPTGYTTSTLVTSVFNVPSAHFTNGKLDLNGDGTADTLLKALSYSTSDTTSAKGAARNLLRTAGVALLNEVKYGSGYPAYASKGDLIKAVNSALAGKNPTTMMSLANTLDKWNNGYCP